MDKKQKKLRRVVVYLEEEDYNKLRASLIMKGMTVSEWIRSVVRSFLTKQTFFLQD